ncbi:sugar ABC transporter substrate-binding protein [Ktedonosporobacter rubrisoli]|uniref:Sugar ABC transporter substrate-binding protein n=1 Tax=Ktedonosporobacter rubrisoli TaxID=2509675 RepID=A0A4P6JNQ2_KTERU|nr:sugar ABC transporter substrate-binding protein [Ktedonosporobacter rubrisoli]QBD76875.1 sugar ABC transporter substrate-binding protein [Ktedonosporobacter rubrisoli]
MSMQEKHDLVRQLLERRISRRAFTTRAMALGLSVGTVGSIVAACGSSGGSSGTNGASGQITVWTWPDNDKTFAQTVPIFQKKHPNIKVNVQAFPNADTDYANKLLSALVSGSGPDVAMIEIGVIAKFKSKPGFVDLSQDPYKAKQYQDSYAKYAWDYVSDAQSGKIFALPKNTGPGAMFYRRDVFEKAGLPTEPEQVQALLKDWDAFLQAGKKLSVAGKQWLISTPNQIFSTIVGEAGLSHYDAKGNLQLDNPIIKTAMQYAQEAWNAGLISPFADFTAEWGAALESGSIATHFWGNWLGGNLKSVYAKDTAGKWGVTFAPAFNGKTAFDSGGDFIGILESSQNKAAAWEFCKFVTQDMDSLHKMYTANDLYPAWKPALTQDWINESDPYYKDQNVNKIFAQVQSAMTPPITNPNDQIVSNVLTNTLNDITRGKMNIDAALSKAKQQIQANTAS